MYRRIVLFTVLVSLISCQQKAKNGSNDKKSNSFFVGTYTNGESKGIYKYSIDNDGKLEKIGLVAIAENPSFLAKTKDNKTLLAVNEINAEGSGFVTAYDIQKDTLILKGKSKSGGAHPCFIAVDKKNQIIVANYTGGNVGYLKINNKGDLSKLQYVQQHFGKGTTPRQEAPHAHSAWFHPKKDEIISVDLGTNELLFSKVNKAQTKLVYTNQKSLKMMDGAGPRHLSFHPNKDWIYVLNELNNTIALVTDKNGVYEVKNTISMLPQDYSEYSKGADIHISKDGKYLYASNRGHNSIAIFEIDTNNGSLKSIGFTDTKGKNPRNFSLTPDNKYLLVANQDSNKIVCFKRNIESGKLTFVNEVSAPNPVCILF